MAKDFGADVLGIDLSRNMLAIAHERAGAPEHGACSEPPRCQLRAVP
jgi:cyclopropane fatty-acyl-phospholipid synthase-like methyltransferase